MQHLMIVEDEQDISGCLRDFFEGRGFKVRCAFSGEEALDELQKNPADVILLDIMLPGISGLEVLKRAKKIYPGVRAVIVTAHDEVTFRAEARIYGAVAYVTKPFDFSEKTWSSVLMNRTT